ncbi:hypothetical protein [Micromonospora coriariae]|nr:hypothetical protein [Micromonospora coriariae]
MRNSDVNPARGLVVEVLDVTKTYAGGGGVRGWGTRRAFGV